MSKDKSPAEASFTAHQITFTGDMQDLAARVTVLSDTLYLEQNGLPGNLSPLARRIIELVELPGSAVEIMQRLADINRLLMVWPILQTRKNKARTDKAKMQTARQDRKPKHDWAAVSKTELELRGAGRSPREFAAIIEQRHGVPPTTYREWRRKKPTG